MDDYLKIIYFKPKIIESIANTIRPILTIGESGCFPCDFAEKDILRIANKSPHPRIIKNIPSSVSIETCIILSSMLSLNQTN